MRLRICIPYIHTVMQENVNVHINESSANKTGKDIINQTCGKESKGNFGTDIHTILRHVDIYCCMLVGWSLQQNTPVEQQAVTSELCVEMMKP